MPGLFLAIAILATLALTGAHAVAVSRKMALAPGVWTLELSFLVAPDPQKFESVLRAASTGFTVQKIAWSSPTQATLTVSVPSGPPVTVDVGSRSPNDGYTVTSVSQATSSTLALPPGGSGNGLMTPPALKTPVSPGTPPLRAWTLNFEATTTVMDKPAFEADLGKLLNVTQIVRFSWADSRHVSVVITSVSDLKKYVGVTSPVRNIPTTLLSATMIPQMGA